MKAKNCYICLTSARKWVEYALVTEKHRSLVFLFFKKKNHSYNNCHFVNDT